ncbi:MAG: T9SS type A sorting domain-containing protein, partial [Bacteroidota bacterium]
ESARQTAREFDLGSGGYQPLPTQDTITALYPNPPSAGEIFIDFSISDNQLIWLEVFDVPGRRVGVIIGGEYRSPGIYTEKFNTSMLAPGRYYIRMRTLESTRTMPFNVVR